MSSWKRNDQSVFYVVENDKKRLLVKLPDTDDAAQYYWAMNMESNTIEAAVQFSEEQVLNLLKDSKAFGVPKAATITPWKIVVNYTIAEATDLETAEREAAMSKLTQRERELLGFE